VEMAGIEPATATLAGRARYLSCHPHGQASAQFASACRFHGAHAMDVSIIQPVREAFRTVNSSEVNENRPGGTFPWGGCGQVPVRAYPATTPPVRAAGSRGAGFMDPGRFGAWRVVMHP
jgi:hypothetical protein